MGEQVAARTLNKNKPKAKFEFSERRVTTLSESESQDEA